MEYIFNSAVINAIIALLNGYNNVKNCEFEDTRTKIDIDSYTYLIGQCIRQYQVPENHYFTSEQARKLWDELTDDDICRFPGKGSFKCKVEIDYDKYVGSRKTPEKSHAAKGDEIKFNNVFHYDHMVPVSLISDKLCSLDRPTYDDIESILVNIYICRITKAEDRGMPYTKGRTLDFKQVYTEIYKTHKIIIERLEKVIK